MQTTFFILISNFVPTIDLFLSKNYRCIWCLFSIFNIFAEENQKEKSNVIKQKHDSSLFVNFIFAIDSNAIF